MSVSPWSLRIKLSSRLRSMAYNTFRVNAHTDARARLTDSTSAECFFAISPLPGRGGYGDERRASLRQRLRAPRR